MLDVKELLNEIRERAFKDVDLTSLPKMSAEERRSLVWENMERLLALGDNCQTAVWLASQYLDVETDNPNYDNPMLNKKGTDFLDSSVSHLSEEERCFGRFAFDMGILSHHLLAREQLWEDYYFGEGYDNDAYELDEDMQDRYPGLMKIVKESFAVDNKPLVDWVRNSPYRRCSSRVVDIMMQAAADEASSFNSAEQDYYFNSLPINRGLDEITEANLDVEDGLECLLNAAKHKERAKELGLDREQASIVDALCGTFENDYPANYIACAKELQTMATKLLQSRKSEQMDNRDRDKYSSEVFDKAYEIAEKFDIDMSSRYFNICRLYIDDWLRLKYQSKKYDTGRF